MQTESPHVRAAEAAALVKMRRSEALQRKADWAARISRILLSVGAVGIALLLISILGSERGAPIDSSSPRAQRVTALIESGKAFATIMIAGVSLGCMLVSMRFARKWAEAATGSLAQSAPENRRLFEMTQAAGLPFALFLRGFKDEGKALRSWVVIPLGGRRPDKATRWIEGQVLDELEPRGIRVFCVANPSDKYLLPGAIRLEVHPSDWLSEVGELATDANVIVVFVSAVSPGLAAELELLRHERLTHKSVVILARKLHRQGVHASGDFRNTAIAPQVSWWTQSAFGPMVGRHRFLRELRQSIERAIHA